MQGFLLLRGVTLRSVVNTIAGKKVNVYFRKCINPANPVVQSTEMTELQHVLLA